MKTINGVELTTASSSNKFTRKGTGKKSEDQAEDGKLYSPVNNKRILERFIAAYNKKGRVKINSENNAKETDFNCKASDLDSTAKSGNRKTKKTSNSNDCHEHVTGDKIHSDGLLNSDDSDSELGTDSSRKVIHDNETMEKQKSEMSLDERERTVFVGNVPLNAKRKALKKLFAQFGPVASVRLRSIVPEKVTVSKKVASICQKFSPKKHTINAYVKFSSPDHAMLAQSLNGTEYEGHRMRVDRCIGRKLYDSKTTVFVGNLPFAASEDELAEHFEDCGLMTVVRIVRDNVTGAGRGFGFVGFQDSASVQLALKLNEQIFLGRQLRVKRVTKKFQRTAEKCRSKKEEKIKKVESTRKLTKYSTFAEKRNKKKSGQEQKRPLTKRVRKIIRKRSNNSKQKSLLSSKTK